MKQIATAKAPAAIGAYSQAIWHENLLFCSMQIGIEPQSGVLQVGLEAQTRQIFLNLQEILLAAELDLDCVLKVSVFLQDMSRFADFNLIYSQYFNQPYPAREVMEVSALPKMADIGISVIAGNVR
ncbi:MAG: Rid family detoxifying hydrolase [Candidatus Cloacimonetes bacterium]|nr:Rid family detoxifying hydrolase [Candidatus Cloacimonadota bacterium]